MWTLLLFGYIATQFCQVSVPGFSSKKTCEQSSPIIISQLSSNVFPNRMGKGHELDMFSVCVEVK